MIEGKETDPRPLTSSQKELIRHARFTEGLPPVDVPPVTTQRILGEIGRKTHSPKAEQQRQDLQKERSTLVNFLRWLLGIKN
ncbi:hypothetical protein A3D77_06580 [Candidatus Gottesmanbacteria bacterium RIFCSPHIGHO2_02_FULL_39_11]|uniref:Uncharacterized protein n=1 Tax=Candidatus Gottesmanbacteria bacterium RIFCSPHIGHO2_02_FULL_39_11 TaxID=1798382 RepID=A0A1F5ZSL4_9BACT|nr:MAG: hypothetical protein A3D77_06580 [Candidatus Gottesmanbacteria bacterium RIFCSPHIGHO2_02_FULL_39_11]